MSARGNNPNHDWIQPIIVDKAGSHQATIATVAAASVGVYFTSHDESPFPESNYGYWLAGPFGKTVRRTNANGLDKIEAWCLENKVAYQRVSHGGSSALALPPMRYADMPKIVANTQVSGTDFERLPDPEDDTSAAAAHVRVNSELTTGKGAAAAAHAIWAWMMSPDHSDETIAQWVRDGLPFAVSTAAPFILSALEGCPGVATIRDAGLTEVEPNTLTAVAVDLT